MVRKQEQVRMYQAGLALHPVITGVGCYRAIILLACHSLSCSAWLAHPCLCHLLWCTVESCLIHLHSSAAANSRHGHKPSYAGLHTRAQSPRDLGKITISLTSQSRKCASQLRHCGDVAMTYIYLSIYL